MKQRNKQYKYRNKHGVRNLTILTRQPVDENVVAERSEEN